MCAWWGWRLVLQTWLELCRAWQTSHFWAEKRPVFSPVSTVFGPVHRTFVAPLKLAPQPTQKSLLMPLAGRFHVHTTDHLRSVCCAALHELGASLCLIEAATEEIGLGDAKFVHLEKRAFPESI